MSTEPDGGDVRVEDLDEDQLDSLIDRVLDRADERDDTELARNEKNAIQMSRRSVLAGSAAVAGLGGLIGGSTSARGAGEDFGNVSGVMGTDAQPLEETNAKQAHFQEVSTGDLNSVVWIDATASDAQSQIEALGEFEKANVYGGRYDPGSETIIPVRSEVEFLPSAWWEPTSNYSGFLVDIGATLAGQSITGSPFGNTGAPDVLRTPNHVVSIDATRASENGRYDQTDNRSAPEVDWTAYGIREDLSTGEPGHGLKLVSGSSSTPISIQSQVRWESFGFVDAVRVNSGAAGSDSSAYVNFDDFFIYIDDFRNGVHKIGPGGFGTQMRGSIQPDPNSSQVGLYNDSTGGFGEFRGQLWDTDLYSIRAVDGPRVTAFTRSDQISDLTGSGTAGVNTYVYTFEDGGFRVWNGESDFEGRMRFYNGVFALGVDGQQEMIVDPSSNATTFNGDIYMLNDGGEVRMKDGDGGNHRLLPQASGLVYEEPDGTQHDLSTV